MKARGREYNIPGKQGKRFLGMRMRQSFQISEEPGEKRHGIECQEGFRDHIVQWFLNLAAH